MFRRIMAESVHKIKQFAGHKVSEVLQQDVRRGYVSMPLVSPVISRVAMAAPTVAKPKAIHRILIGGMSVQASVLDQSQKMPDTVGKITLVSSPSWLQKCHRDWYEKPWGQPKRYLPNILRVIADNLFPNYPDDKLMTFGMIKAVEEEQRKQLRGLGITLVDDHVDQIRGGLKSVAIYCGSRVIEIDTGSDYQVMHTGRIPIGPEGIPVRHFGDAYSISKSSSQMPRVIVGSGLNLDWACRDMCNLSPIIHLIPRGDRARPDLADKLHATVWLEDAQLEFLDEEELRIRAKDIDGRKIDMRVMTSQVFSAMGFKLDRGLVVVNDPDKVLYVDTAPSPEAIRIWTSSTGKKSAKATDLRGTMVPDGNMMLNFLKIQKACGHFTLTEGNAVLLTTAWKIAIVEKAAAVGVRIEPEFFSNIEHRVKHSFEKAVPNETQIWQIIKNTYEKGVSVIKENLSRDRPTAIDSQGKPITWEDFKKLIMGPTDVVVRVAGIIKVEPDERAKLTH